MVVEQLLGVLINLDDPATIAIALYPLASG